MKRNQKSVTELYWSIKLHYIINCGCMAQSLLLFRIYTLDTELYWVKVNSVLMYTEHGYPLVCHLGKFIH